MTFEDWLRIAQLAVTVGSGALSIYLYVRSADRAKVESLATTQQEFERRCAAFDRRLSVLEVRVDGAPTHGDLIAIREDIREICAGVAAIAERSESTQKMVISIQDYLMEGGRK